MQFTSLLRVGERILASGTVASALLSKPGIETEVRLDVGIRDPRDEGL